MRPTPAPTRVGVGGFDWIALVCDLTLLDPFGNPFGGGWGGGAFSQHAELVRVIERRKNEEAVENPSGTEQQKHPLHLLSVYECADQGECYAERESNARIRETGIIANPIKHTDLEDERESRAGD